MDMIRSQMKKGNNKAPNRFEGDYGGFGQGHAFTFENHPSSVFAGSPTGPVFEVIKNLFVKNGDHLSYQYTGTESNISRVTKQGGQGIMGKLE